MVKVMNSVSQLFYTNFTFPTQMGLLCLKYVLPILALPSNFPFAPTSHSFKTVTLIFPFFNCLMQNQGSGFMV